jgi:hypothetical protein
LAATILASTALKVDFLCRIDLRIGAGSIVIFSKGVFSIFSRIIFVSFVFGALSIILINIISVVVFLGRFRIFIEIIILISLNVIFFNIRITRFIGFYKF